MSTLEKEVGVQDSAFSEAVSIDDNLIAPYDDKTAVPSEYVSHTSSIRDGESPTVLPKLSSTAGTLASVRNTHEDEKTTASLDVELGLSSKLNTDTDTVPGDPNLVDYDGSTDSLNAHNWSKRKKWSMVAILSAMTFITPLASSMFAPGVPGVLAEFHSSDALLGAFVVSVYVLGYAAGPIVIAPLSELYGRSPMYTFTNLLFILFTVACAVSTNLGMLIGFRFLEGCAGSAVVTMGGGTIADMFTQAERGTAMAVWSMGPLLGPVVGPVAGGFLSQAVSWRWVFWVITITAAVCSIGMIFIISESYAPVLLERKAEHLRRETGNLRLVSKLHSGLSSSDHFKRSIVRPMKMLSHSPIVLLLSIHMAIVYGYLYLLFTTVTEVFETTYAFSSGVVGLTFLGLGMGMLFGLAIFGFVTNVIFKRYAVDGVMKPEYRFLPMIPGALCIPIGMFLYGWTAQYHIFWFVPIVGTCLVGLGIITTFMPITTYLVDVFTLHAASALAANTVLRSTVGALLPLAGPKMYSALGLGWGNSLLGFVSLAMVPIPYLFFKYGERMRTSERWQVKF